MEVFEMALSPPGISVHLRAVRGIFKYSKAAEHQFFNAAKSKKRDNRLSLRSHTLSVDTL